MLTDLDTTVSVSIILSPTQAAGGKEYISHYSGRLDCTNEREDDDSDVNSPRSTGSSLAFSGILCTKMVCLCAFFDPLHGKNTPCLFVVRGENTCRRTPARSLRGLSQAVGKMCSFFIMLMSESMQKHIANG